MFPKAGRVVSPATVAAYCVAHPRCEIIGCTRPPMPTPHHIRPVGNGGDDVEGNLIRLCWHHHLGPEGYHALGRLRWLNRFRDRLRPDALAKVLAVVSPMEV